MSADNDVIGSKEIYYGSENNLAQEEVFHTEFVCSFDKIQTYPFGDQTCDFIIMIMGDDSHQVNFKFDSLFHRDQNNGTY